jgi:hypothetical protein
LSAQPCASAIELAINTEITGAREKRPITISTIAYQTNGKRLRGWICATGGGLEFTPEGEQAGAQTQLFPKAPPPRCRSASYSPMPRDPGTLTRMKLLLVLFVTGSLAWTLRAADKPKAGKGKLTSIQGIAEVTEAKLNRAGINNVNDLLEEGSTPKGREEMAERSGLPAAQILSL